MDGSTAPSSPNIRKEGRTMAQDKIIKLAAGVEPVPDLDDIGRLFEPDLGDPITESAILNVPIGKPRDFFRTHPDRTYRRRTTIYTHKPEGVVETQYFIVAPAMQGLIDEARPCNLVVIVDRV